ncbi:MAG: tripartite tricarboxylate transporter substrate binding protein [Betaproteobacteria bacterium]|nr:tripartite tricarboxylate transporter substrate binding protein [Betaproteobacteria bacterium]
MKLRTLLKNVLGASLLLCMMSVAAEYPERPIRIVVPTTQGGGADTLARVLAKLLSERFPQQAFAENRPGANGIIGVDAVAKAAPDGYTLLLTFADHFVNPSLHASLPFDMLGDFAPVIYLGALPFVLVVHPSLPVNSVQQLVALARAKPDSLNFASVGTGGMVHMAAELFKVHAGIEMRHVPYKGSSAALPDLISNRIQLMFTSAISAKPFVDAGQLRMVAVTSTERAPTLPNLPTVAESGLPGYAVLIWYGMLAPARTPAPIIARLNAEIGNILGDPAFRATMGNSGISVAPRGTPEEFGGFYRAEMAKWAKVVKETNVKASN